ncbi:hypothetical protein Patl1_04659 [Pistacia atlantica]|uniref:Uncharacterized protein n=1 Tax=Pistacia atlantica TaxID=434234 RepID=A0ACC1BRB0_9ROSI|nr:hypothetical protein Patl1_04659 [Pistacia atlantica]
MISPWFQPSIPSSSSKAEKSFLKNISYKLSFTLQSAVKFNGTVSLFKFSSASQMRVDIADEGVYDTETAVEISTQAIRLKLNMENGFEHRHGPHLQHSCKKPLCASFNFSNHAWGLWFLLFMKIFNHRNVLLNEGGWLEVNEVIALTKSASTSSRTQKEYSK